MIKDRKLQQLFLDQLKDFYGAETEIAASLPGMIDSASSEKLRSVLADHLQMAQSQLSLMKKVFENLDERPEGQPGPAVNGLLQEGKEVVSIPDGEIRDAALIILARKIHHYELASYGSLVALAGEFQDKETMDLFNNFGTLSPLSASS